ncbi:MAG: FtsX-like permease family protein [Bacteroidota bacterium]
MFNNQFKIIIRTLLKQKTTTFIHISGLALGLACCFFIYLFIHHEHSFDQYHPEHENIYRVNWETSDQTGASYSASVPNPVAEALRIDFPDLRQVARMYMTKDKVYKTDEQQQFKVTNTTFAEPELLDLFTFKTVQGDLAKTLTNPNQAAISRSTARRLFGTEQVMGRMINYKNKIDLEITSIIEDIPSNTHIPADFLIGYVNMTQETLGFPVDRWSFSFGSEVFVLVPEHYDLDQFDQRLTAMAEKNMGEYYDEGESTNFVSQALDDIHFDTQYGSNSPATPTRPIYLWIFASIGLFVLAIAAFNFINLSTVQALKRANEVGVRKVLGAEKKHLITQFLGESLLISILAGILAIAITQLFLPYVNTLFKQQVTAQLFHSPIVWLFFIGAIILVGILAGIYPAIGLSRFQPARVLKSKNSSGNRRSLLLRRSLVIAQFTITLVLLIGTLVISRQVNYLKNKDLGFNQEAMLVVKLPDNEQIEALRNEWGQNEQIQKISFGIGAPIANSGFVTEIEPKHNPQNKVVEMNAKLVDINYMDTYGLELVAGRWMTPDEEQRTATTLPRDQREYKFVVNESMVKKWGYAHPDQILGEEFKIGINEITAEVIGVIKDFNVSSLHNKIMPTVLLNFPQVYRSAGMKVNTQDLSSTIAQIERVWKGQFPEHYFEYHFLDEHIAKLYEGEMRLFYLFRIFASIAILIGRMGLWGLINFITEQRSKEISIRKVLGASMTNIISLLSKDFVRLVLIAGVISIPFAWVLSNRWLEDFHYRIDTPWGLYLLAIIITVCIAFATMSVQSLKAASVNPAENLKNE